MTDQLNRDDFLQQVIKLDLADLLKLALHEPDAMKRQIYDAIFTYRLAEQQEKVIARKDFVR